MVAAMRSRRARAARRRRYNPRAVTNPVLASGVGATTLVPFGPTWRRRKANGKSLSLAVKRGLTLGLSASHPYHLGLPRPIGDYAVVRTTAIHNLSSKVVIFAPFQDLVGTQNLEIWLNTCGVCSVTNGSPINGSSNATQLVIPVPGGGGDYFAKTFSCVPSALSVQVLNPNALQSTSGIIAASRVMQQLELGNNPMTWDAFASSVISFTRPRLLSAGKLALRGVYADAVPLDMEEFCSFRQMQAGLTVPITWTSTSYRPGGLSPIVFVNLNEVALDYLVTMEWRVRFDISNPAMASHSYHESTPDTVWGNILRCASNEGHGIKDIVEGVVDAGYMLKDMIKGPGVPSGPGLPALPAA